MSSVSGEALNADAGAKRGSSFSAAGDFCEKISKAGSRKGTAGGAYASPGSEVFDLGGASEFGGAIN
jgi:hypothetical protein